jgi:hypothetical protein
MRRHLIVLVLAATAGLCAAGPARADACAETIAALFDGGPLDPMVRPKRREQTLSVAPDGTVTPVVEALWESVTRVVSHSNGIYILADGANSWTGPGWTGPWTAQGATMPADGGAMSRAQTAAMARNLSETECLGEGDLGGQRVTAYRYRTRTEPNDYGAWWGAHYTAYLDAASRQLVRLDAAEGVSSWAPAPAAEVQVTLVTYDETIRIAVPD